jgi:Tfp pilus assembly protein PilF
VILVLATGPALAAIAVPLATTAAVRSSQTAARTGDYGAALGYLLAAERVEPAAASPRLEQALVYEQAGALPAANRAIDEASSRQPTDWRIWLVASRLAAELGRPGLAVSEYRRARSLNPTSVLFRQP